MQTNQHSGHIEEVYIKEEPGVHLEDLPSTSSCHIEEVYIKEEPGALLEDLPSTSSCYPEKKVPIKEEPQLMIEDFTAIFHGDKVDAVEMTCYYCGHSTVSLGRLRRHIVCLHAIRQQRSECPKYAAGPWKRRGAKNIDEKLFLCNISNNFCLYSNGLKRHMWTHKKEKQFQCTVCSYRCRKESTMKKHMLSHSEEKPFQCTMCNFKCLQSAYLKKHMRTHIRSSKKRIPTYNNEQLEEAMVEVKAGMPVRTAALKFNIPKTTLLYKSCGKLSPSIGKPGPDCVLGQDNEKYLVEWIFSMKKRGFPITKSQLLNSVRMLLNITKKKTIFPNNMPGPHWYNAFRRRHPEISERIVQNLTYSRAAVSEEKIRAWFHEVRDHLEPLGLLDIDDTRKLNLAESAFKLNPKCNSVLVTKGYKTAYNMVGNDECLTTLVCGNAAGQMLPPMILFPYKRIPRNIATSMPKDWGIGCSDSGWMTAETFYEYVTNVFHPWLLKNGIKFPVILYLDGHASHLSYPLTKFCREKNIELIALYPNATHILQPLDVAMFHPLKAAWRTEVRNWRMEHNGESLKRENFAPLLEKSLKMLNLGEILRNGFKASGLHPFTPDAINYNKYFGSSKIENTAEDGSSINCAKIIDNLKFIESNIENNILEQFKIQEKSAQWNGSKENANLFLFWQKIKKMASSHYQTTLHKDQLTEAMRI